MKLKLKEAQKEDCLLIFNWANDPEVRHFSFSSESITWNDHQLWFQQYLQSHKSWIYIAMLDDNKAVGQIRFDLVTSGEIEIDISLSKEFRGKGLATQLIQAGIEKLLYNNRNIKQFLAWIKSTNMASLKTFQRAGFKVAKTSNSKTGAVLLSLEHPVSNPL